MTPVVRHDDPFGQGTANDGAGRESRSLMVPLFWVPAAVGVIAVIVFAVLR